VPSQGAGVVGADETRRVGASVARIVSFLCLSLCQQPVQHCALGNLAELGGQPDRVGTCGVVTTFAQPCLRLCPEIDIGHVAHVQAGRAQAVGPVLCVVHVVLFLYGQSRKK